MKPALLCEFALACWIGHLTVVGADWTWVEGERPTEARVTRNPGWYDQVPKGACSGNDFISHFDEQKTGEATYDFEAPTQTVCTFWIRANPHESKLSYRLNDGEWTAVNTTNSVQRFSLSGWDMRFLAWIDAGKVTLGPGRNQVRFRFESATKHHGLLDCFVFAGTPFTPFGVEKPDDAEAKRRALADDEANWFDFRPATDAFRATSAIDLRRLNESVAGEQGRIVARGGGFVHGATGKPVRFWAVNGPPHDLKGEALKNCARMLAKRGVNLVRTHGAMFNEKTGELVPARVQHLVEVVEAMREEGIYVLASIYFPLWFKPQAGLDWLPGYDGNQHPFATLMFNEAFQRHWESWWRAVLTAKTSSGRPLAEEPALMGVEVQNEDSFFFWTFTEKNLPEAQLRQLESQFAGWLTKRHGSLAQALAAWGDVRHPRDSVAEGRAGFRPLWEMFTRKTLRDRETAAFLLETQQAFYRWACRALRSLGFDGLITCSNWTTASPEVLGPLEKLSYTTGDFLDRHGYFGCRNGGLFSEWSIRDGHTYIDRSALRFEAEDPSAPAQFNHPAIDVEYDGKPSMISETTWTRPNRYRSEAPLFLAAYGALQDSDAIVHFALDGGNWAVKPGYFMQPWTLMAPAQMGQFPGAALIFREGLIAPGAVLAHVRLGLSDLLELKGTPLPQDAAFDELRLKDVPSGSAFKSGSRLDPLLHFAGRARVSFTPDPQASEVADLTPWVKRADRTVTSTTRELRLDYGQGVLTVDAPAVQGVSGNLRAAGEVHLTDATFRSSLEIGHFVLVALDRQPLKTSRRMLLQVMSEEKNSGWKAVPQGNLNLIESIGRDPWRVRKLDGSVLFHRADSAPLKATALDANGEAIRDLGPVRRLELLPDVLYYLLEG